MASTLKTAELMVVAAILGGAVGLAAAALPSQVRILGMFAVGCGVVVGIGTRWLADGVGVRSRWRQVVAAVLASTIVVSVYGGRSSQRFADAEAARNGREKMVEILLREMPSDMRQDIPVEPLPRWLRWRTKSLRLTGEWPAVFAAGEALACVLAAVAVVRWLPS